jgi:DNA repair exonuclease SbcCD ATPase subunit
MRGNEKVESGARELMKQDLKQTILALDEVSDAMSNATFDIIGNLSMEEAQILRKVKEKQAEHKRFKDLASEADQVLDVLLHENAKQKKLDDAYKKLKGLRDKKLAISEKIRGLEQKLETLKIGKEGGGLIQETLTSSFDALLGKVRRISMLFPDLYVEVQNEIQTFYKIQRDLIDKPSF